MTTRSGNRLDRPFAHPHLDAAVALAAGRRVVARHGCGRTVALHRGRLEPVGTQIAGHRLRALHRDRQVGTGIALPVREAQQHQVLRGADAAFQQARDAGHVAQGLVVELVHARLEAQVDRQPARAAGQPDVLGRQRFGGDDADVEIDDAVAAQALA